MSQDSPDRPALPGSTVTGSGQDSPPDVYSFQTMPYVYPGMKVADAAGGGLRGWNREVAGMGSIAALILAGTVTRPFDGGVMLESPICIPERDDVLSYDDGSAKWIVWSGTYKGVWFNLADFGMSGNWDAHTLEFWFYHHVSYPWDVSAFYGDIYNGGAAAPEYWLSSTSATATHFAPLYIPLPSPVSAEDEFWLVVETGFSAGGWPSSLLDDTPNAVDHSFYSYDFADWTPWQMGDLLFRTYDYWFEGIDTSTWAEIKTLFD